MDELLADVGRIAWSQCWQVTLLVAGVWLVLRLVGRNRPHLACGLWLVVLLKCITPPLVSSPSGIFCWMQREDSVEAEPTVLAAAAPVPAAAPAESAVVVQASPAVAALPPLPAAKAMPADLPPGRLEPLDRRPAWRWSSLVRIGGLAWLAGAMMYAALALVRWRICWRKIRRSPPVESPELVALVQQLRQRLKLRRTVRLLITEVPLGPAVIGLWRPTIILPAAVARDKSPQELAPLIAHELIHIRRGDLWIGVLQTLALAVWWFHPLVRLASRLVTREAERCCDEETIAHLGCDPAAYARSLLDVLALKQHLTPIPAFPGVRPVDVTSQRLERIMQLGQGCHKRTPWWCWLVMLAAAAAVLPGAAFVAGADETPQYWPDLRPQPAAKAPELTARKKQPPQELEQRYYDVTELMQQLMIDQGQSPEQAQQWLTVLMRAIVPGGKDFTWQFPVQRIRQHPDGHRLIDENHAMLSIRHTREGHERIKEQLAILREHGHAELAVEVRIISGPAAVLNAEGIDWRMVGSPPKQASPVPGERQAGGSPSDLQGTAVSVIEKNVPALQALIDDRQAKKLLEAAQSHPRTNVMQAPKVTLFNGQTASIQDCAQRPFVVGVTPVGEGDKTAHQPTIRVVNEGTLIRLRPVAHKDGTIELDFDLELSEIRDVDTAEFPAGPGKDPITVQVPEIHTTLLSTRVEMKSEQTLVLSVPKTAKGKKEQQPLCVLVQVRKLDKRPPASSGPSAAETAPVPRDNVDPPAGVRKQRALTIYGWSLRFENKEGGTLDIQPGAGGDFLADLHIRGGGRFEAVTQKNGAEQQDRIAGEADSISITWQPATKESPAKLRVAMEGSVQLSHNKSRLEAKRIRLQFEDPVRQESDPKAKPASVRLHVDGAESIDMPAGHDFQDNVQFFPVPPAKPAGVLVDKVYPVADLVIPIPTGPIKISRIATEAAPVAKPDFGSLIELITTTIRPDTWYTVGGEGEISTATNNLSLIIRQDEQVHERIAELLKQLRRLQDIQVVMTIEPLTLPSVELKIVAGKQDSSLAAIVENPKLRAWHLKREALSTLKSVAGAKAPTGPKITAFNGQTVELALPPSKDETSASLSKLLVQPVVTADFRSIRMQLGGSLGTIQQPDRSEPMPRSVVELAQRTEPLANRSELQLVQTEVPAGQTLVVDVSQFAWQSNEIGVPLLDKVPSAERLFKNTSAKKPDTRHFYLITPRVLVVSEPEASRVLAPKHQD